MRYPQILITAWVFTMILSCGDSTDPFGDVSIDTDITAQESQNQRLDRFFAGQSPIQAKLLVSVSDIQGNPVGRTDIRIGDQQYSTDNDGLVYISDQLLRPVANGLICSKQGYYEAIKSVNVTGAEQVVEVTLIQRSFSRDFVASAGGTLELEGVELEFQPMSIINKDGSLYEGRVTVAAYHYDPEDERFNQLAAGQFYGLDDQDRLSALATYGMVQIEMTDAEGSELEIREGYQVSVTIPASTDAPESIPLWNLNEAYGLWVEDGVAIKEGGVYQFEVSHFSTYNCDVPANPCSSAITSEYALYNTLGQLMTNQTVEMFYGLGESNATRPFGQVTSDKSGMIRVVHCGGESNIYFKSENCHDITGPYELNQTVQDVVLKDKVFSRDLLIYIEGCLSEFSGNPFFGSVEAGEFSIGFSGIVENNGSIELASCDLMGVTHPDSRLSLTILGDDRSIYHIDDVVLVTEPAGSWVADVGLCNPATVDDDFVIEFSDAVMRDELLTRFDVDEITFGMAKEITTVILSYRDIENLSGIEYFVNLNKLVISNSDVPNLFDYISSNTSLEVLWLRSVNLDNVKGISILENLKSLIINDTDIETVGEIAVLEHLERLDLGNNKLRSIAEPLRSEGIHTLNLTQNNLTNVDGLSSITLVQDLDLSYNVISDFKGLRNMTSLDSLNIVQNRITSFRWFPALSGLKKLDAQNVVMENFEGLTKLNGLHKLTLELTDGSMQELSNLVELRELILSGNGSENRRVDDLSFLEPLIKLEVLRIDGLDSGDHGALTVLKELKELSISDSQMTEIPDLQMMTKLECLGLSNNNISDIEVLLNLTQLKRLSLTDNPISEADQQRLMDALPNTTIWF